MLLYVRTWPPPAPVALPPAGAVSAGRVVTAVLATSWLLHQERSKLRDTHRLALPYELRTAREDEFAGPLDTETERSCQVGHRSVHLVMSGVLGAPFATFERWPVTARQLTLTLKSIEYFRREQEHVGFVARLRHPPTRRIAGVSPAGEQPMAPPALRLQLVERELPGLPRD